MHRASRRSTATCTIARGRGVRARTADQVGRDPLSRGHGMTRERRRSPESQDQRAICQHLDARGVPGLVWFAVPNGNKLGGKISAKGIAIQGSINKGLGVKAGVSDLIFLHDSKFFALELKVGKNRPTEQQLEFID